VPAIISFNTALSLKTSTMSLNSRSFTLACWLCALITAALALAFMTPISAVAAEATDTSQWPVLVDESFAKGADHWEPTDAAAWKLIPLKSGDQAFSLFKQSNYKPQYRSPFNYALCKDLEATDFELTVTARSTAREYGHRDVVLVFGHQNPNQFYYVHVATKADDHAHQIFIVNNAARTKISTKSTAGIKWTEDWHQLRVVRTVADEQIAVFFDDFKTPIMTAADKTFAHGRIGIGSFDDTADFDQVTIKGKKK
jgi:hypothetical protein